MTRKRFNVVKTRDINIQLLNSITDNETINNIKERFNNGFRYWTASNYQ